MLPAVVFSQEMTVPLMCTVTPKIPNKSKGAALQMQSKRTSERNYW
jgi:hypothetical protein